MAHPTDDKNFRLTRDVLPERCAFDLSLELDAGAFTGQGQLELALAKPTKELVLHAAGLELGSARVTWAGGEAGTSAIRAVEVSETVVLTLDAEVPAGKATLALSWSGRFTEGLRGLYKAGKVVATQFEAADARRAFPCFDEPAFKARWALSVEVPSGLTALSNGRVVSETEVGAEGDVKAASARGAQAAAAGGLKAPRKRVRFEETETLSSYLVALVIGPLVATAEDRAGDVPVRTWTLAEKSHLASFGQSVAVEVLPRLSAYFGLPYAFGKVDQAGIPDFEAGAMENAGLITYREIALLLDPANASLAMQKRVAEVITHELAHQWFGNWVTMAWWDDLWLNEAFATWMAFKIVDAWRPEWRMWLEFDQGKAAALHLDALGTTHPVRGEVRNANEATEAFDVITYEKGGAVLRMIEGFLGEAPFREGIRDYMKRFARSNAVADDLWKALEISSKQPVVELANAWIRQSGYPMVEASLDGSTLKLAQRRFFSEPGREGDERWPVPLVVRYRRGETLHEQRLLFSEGSDTLRLEGDGEPDWLVANADASGFYRVAYDAALLTKLGAHLDALSPAERVALLSDLWALTRADRVPLARFLELAASFGEEHDEAVLDELTSRLAYLERRIVPEGGLAPFRAFVAELLGGQLAKAGWDAAPDETDLQRLQRAALVRAVGGIARAPEVIDEATKRVIRVLDGDASALEPNLLDTAFHIAARGGDATLFDRLEARFRDEPDPATQRRYLSALAAFEAEPLTARARALFFDKKVPLQDSSSFAAGLLANRIGRDAAFEAITSRWAEVHERLAHAPMLMRRVIEAMGQLPERRHLEAVRAHLKANPLPEAAQAIGQTLERMEQDVAFRERAKDDVAAWLGAR